MDRNTIRKEIITLANSVKSQSDTLANEKYPSQLELELFLHKVEKLYQKSIVFNHLSLFDGFEERMTTPAPEENEVTLPVPTFQTEKTLDIPIVPVEMPPIVESPVASEKTAALNPEKKEERPIERKSSQTRISDLKSSIGINDKFQFTNELFKGNMQEFNIAIEQLNTSETLDSAMAYISGLKRLYGWEEDNETVKRLLNLVERRYN